MQKFTVILSALVILLALSRCTSKEDVSSSYRATDKELNTALKEMLGQNSSLKVIDVKYIETENQCINVINYTMNGKKYGNVALLKGTGTVFANKKPVELNVRGITIRCTGSCTGTTTPCSMVGVYDPETKTNTIECSCEGCAMETH